MGKMSTTSGIQTVITEITYSSGIVDTTETRTAVVNPTGYSKTVVTTSDSPQSGDTTVTTTIVEPDLIVDTDEVDRVYVQLIEDHKAVLDEELAEKKINSDLYAKALISMMQSSQQLAVTTVQQQPVLDAQVAKTQADKEFVETQDEELSNSVIFNNKIKALDSYGDMIGTMGAGSLVISTDMWTSFFNMVGDLNSSMGNNPSNTTITKAT